MQIQSYPQLSRALASRQKLGWPERVKPNVGRCLADHYLGPVEHTMILILEINFEKRINYVEILLIIEKNSREKVIWGVKYTVCLFFILYFSWMLIVEKLFLLGSLIESVCNFFSYFRIFL